MVGETLGDRRERIESLASADGEFAVVCGRTGVRPVPVAGKRFPDRDSAEAAAQEATAYRAVLRRWDPRAPWYDFIACEVPPGLEIESGWEPARANRPDASLTGFCHDVAAAVFDALSEQGFADIESTIMDAYCESADAIDDPDELCLHLLATLAAELDSQLLVDEQARVLRAGAEALPSPPGTESPLTGTFERLQSVTLIGDYDIDATRDWTVGQQSWTVTIEEYAFETTGAMPTLPIVVDLLRRLPKASLALDEVRQIGEATWQFELTATENGPSAGLARVQPTG